MRMMYYSVSDTDTLEKKNFRVCLCHLLNDTSFSSKIIYRNTIKVLLSPQGAYLHVNISGLINGKLTREGWGAYFISFKIIRNTS